MEQLHGSKPVCHKIYYGNHNGIFGRGVTMYKTFPYGESIVYGVDNITFFWRLRLNKIFRV